jgi:predicted CXXCH cytochrome family protein
MADVVRNSRSSGRVVAASVIVLLLAASAAAGLRAAWPRLFADPRSEAARAYDRGRWSDAARLAREALKARPDDPDAARLLARSTARLGRDNTALGLYARRVGTRSLGAEDYLLVGQALHRQGQSEEAYRAWDRALDAGPMPAPALEELTRELLRSNRHEGAARAAERLGREPGFGARAAMMLGTARAALNDVAGAAEAFRHALALDPNEVEHSSSPAGLRKLVARTFLRAARPGEARDVLRPLLGRGDDLEASWLLSRVALQEGKVDEARSAMDRTKSYRPANPLEPEPGPYAGEARCQKCHQAIFRDALTSRHSQTYYRGAQLAGLPRPERPLPDPDNPRVTHAVVERGGALHEQTRVDGAVLDAVVEYAFGTPDRYLTNVARDADGRYRISRLSYYRTAEGSGWDRTVLDHEPAAHADDYQGETVGTRDGVVKCLYCHETNTRGGRQRDRIGPETADRAVGCERCHGPGANHLAAVAARLPDLAIMNPAGATPQAVTERQCNDCHILGRGLPADADGYDRDRLGWLRSQSVGWGLSRCNTESAGAAGCVTCHDPHKSATAATTSHHEAKCLGCHAAAGNEASDGGGPKSCPVNPSSGCVGCHMPRVRVDALHLDLTEHLIRARPPR